MALFELVRVAVHTDGAFGVLLEAGLPFACTLERTYGPAREPQRIKIPSGRYICHRRRYNRGGYDSFEVTGVPGHSLILFHRGNLEHDSEGCILLGRRWGTLAHNRPAVLESRPAFADFMRRARGRDSFELLVIEPAIGSNLPTKRD